MTAAALATGVLALTGCGPGVPEVTVVQPAPPGGPAYTVTETRRLSAENVAALVLAANQATIQRAQVARARASNPQVRAFADRVLSESQTAEALIQTVLAQYDITPKPEATAQLVNSHASRTVSLMQSATGLEVDRIYLEAESANTRWLIGTLNSVIPSIADSGVERELEAVRNALTNRLMEAERLEQMLFTNSYFRNHNHRYYNNHKS